ncbi:hypothetical protein EV363DRAFT_1298076 [Boletus edulis]|nr:hypothetical protein EV363DRAFT_1298076 [Boletus edulis]
MYVFFECTFPLLEVINKECAFQCSSDDRYGTLSLYSGNDQLAYDKHIQGTRLGRSRSLVQSLGWISSCGPKKRTQRIRDDVAPPLSLSTDDEENLDKNTDEPIDDESSLPPEPTSLPHPIPVQTTRADNVMKARLLVARLRWPFGVHAGIGGWTCSGLQADRG